MYRLSGRTVQTAATAGHACFGLWNPHSTLRIRTAEIAICMTAAPNASNGLAVKRTTARGTVTTSSTADIDNDIQRMLASASGASLDLQYSAQPTVDASQLWQWSFAAVANSAVMAPIEISIPPGTGIILANLSATATPVADVSVAWREEW